MATLLWLAIGVLLALLAWLLPTSTLAITVVVAALTLIGLVLPREVTSAGAKTGIGFGATYVLIFAPTVLRDPLGASGGTYLFVGGGGLIVMAGLAALWRKRRRRQRALKAAADLL